MVFCAKKGRGVCTLKFGIWWLIIGGSLYAIPHRVKLCVIPTPPPPPRMQECGISKSDGTVVFGQLLGICNHVSFTLGRVYL